VHGAHGIVELVIAVMTETRISDVEIISMLIPVSASALKNVADTPGASASPHDQ